MMLKMLACVAAHVGTRYAARAARAPACPKQPRTNFSARFTFVSPWTIKTSPFARCGNWSERRSLRLSMLRTRRASSRRPTPTS
jgi:hypothetical protein